MIFKKIKQDGWIKRENGVISFVGDFSPRNFFNDLQEARHHVHEAVTRRKFEDVLLDFSGVTFITHHLIVSVISQINDFRQKQSINFRVKLPMESAVKALFLNANWAYYLDGREEEHYQRSHNNGDHFPLIKVSGAGSIDRIVNDICEFFLSTIEKIDRNSLSAIEFSLNEVLDNAINHSGTSECFVSIYNTSDVIEFIVIDEGMGIKRSIQKHYPNLRGDINCIKESIKEGVSGTGEYGRGNGLYISCEMAQDAGFCTIWSGMGLVQLGENTELRTKKSNIPLGGTYVQLKLDYRKENLLDNALGAREYSPDYIDRQQGDYEEYTIIVKEERSFGGTRESGKKFYTKVLNILESNSSLNIDFEDVSVITSSFADEAFAKLFITMGFSSYMQRVKIKNTSPLINKIIDRAITKRMSS